MRGQKTTLKYENYVGPDQDYRKTINTMIDSCGLSYRQIAHEVIIDYKPGQYIGGDGDMLLTTILSRVDDCPYGLLVTWYVEDERSGCKYIEYVNILCDDQIHRKSIGIS